MLIDPQNLTVRVNHVRSRMNQAALAAGRNPDSVSLVAVSKSKPAEMLRAAATAGVTDFGESYLQEAMPKLDALADLPLQWHFVGGMQSNKTRPIAERFQWVHSVDRLSVARRLSEQRPFHSPPLNVCIQVAIVPEPSKGGVLAYALESLATSVVALPRLRLRGLMCIPPANASDSDARDVFNRLRSIKDAMNLSGHTLDTLSMGMSGDFEAAIAEGATLVRIGTALFDER